MYWSGSEFEGPTAHMIFFFTTGSQYSVQSGDGFAWAVADGDIGAVPVPAAVWLFGSGLIGLVGLARRKTNA